MINLSQMAIADMTDDQIKTELANRYVLVFFDGQQIRIEGTRAELEVALEKARVEQAA